MQIAKALPFFHAITGCDTISAFAAIGKRTAWDVWNAFPQITTVFSNFSKPLCKLNDSCLDIIERYVVLMYSKTTELEKVNEARQLLFSKGRRSVENIPPTQAALLQHIILSIYLSSRLHLETNASVSTAATLTI